MRYYDSFGQAAGDAMAHNARMAADHNPQRAAEDRTAAARCGTPPGTRLTGGDQEAVTEFRGYLRALRTVREYEATHQPADSGQRHQQHADRRDHFAKVIYEYWNPGRRWNEAHPDDQIAYRADADAAMTAADAAAGTRYAPPLRADVYQEVADRISLYSELEKAQTAGVAGVADKVREWAEQANSATQPEPEVSAAVDAVHALLATWRAAGPPPLGVSIARWWDARLVELDRALATDRNRP